MSKRNSEGTHEKAERPGGVDETSAGMRYFGPKVRELREGYHARLAENQNATLLGKRAGLTASAVVDCLKHEGYVLSLPSYGEIEAGGNLPRDAARFLTIIERCLHLKPEERRDLEHRLAFDILRARLGDRASLVLSPPEAPARKPQHPAMLGVVLRDLRQTAGLTAETLAQALFDHGFTLNARELHVLERLRLSPATYLAGQLVDVEQSALQAPWPFEMPPSEFITQVSSCLPEQLLAEERLRYALTLDDLARRATGVETPDSVR